MTVKKDKIAELKIRLNIAKKVALTYRSHSEVDYIIAIWKSLEEIVEELS